MSFIEKFTDHRYAQCHMRHYDDGTTALISYNTCAAELDAEGWLRVNGLYSMTTRKHLSWFAKELSRVFGINLTYGDMRDLYTSGDMLNLHTGEVRDFS